MLKLKNIFFGKKILIYGLGKSGISSYNFLKDKADVYLFDDNLNIKAKIKKKFISQKKIFQIEFDKIILSPGIDISNCKLSKFLKINFSKIYTDLDVFYSFYKNDCITITGTNGKSTTCKLLYEILSDQKFDVKLVGNIGKPILSVKNVKPKTIFVIEASSYQLEYSKIFKSKFSVILNISPDHIERHKTFDRYVEAKFKLLKNQIKGNTAFVKKDDHNINKKLKSNKLKSNIIKVNTKKIDLLIKRLDNKYFFTDTNKENLSFVLAISKKLNLKRNLLKDTIKNFKGLKYRQQVIYKRNNLTVINDSKSTSFSSSISLLKNYSNIYWLLGGIYKKKDKLNLQKKYFKNIKAFIFGKNQSFFIKKLKGKIKFQSFYNLDAAIKKIFSLIKKDKLNDKTILFSPCAASFDSFKNFEDRGLYFNKSIKRYLNGL
tara:strand:- start:197 stop:1492 length:1296 start_codon:yes stop_codon:yes gene_type:complete